MRIAYTLVAWMAWLGCGAYVFRLPQLVGRNGDALFALEGASPQVKLSVALWVIGSIILFALLMVAVQQALTVKSKHNQLVGSIPPEDGIRRS